MTGRLQTEPPMLEKIRWTDGHRIAPGHCYLKVGDFLYNSAE